MSQTTKRGAAKPPVTVLFVGGYGRSGSTIIDLLLDRVPGVVSVGECRHLFGRALGDNELCSCGRKFNDCPYWKKVIKKAFPKGYDRTAIQQAVKAFNTMRRTPQVLRPKRLNPKLRQQAKIYGEAFSAIYRAIAEVSGASVIVDSSKYPLHGLFIRSLPGIKVKTMLLVRDPRAVAYSWTRYRLRPEVHWEERPMPQHHVVRSALAWNASNRLTKLGQLPPSDFRLQRYEDFVTDPNGQLEQIASFAFGKPTPVGPAIFERQVKTPHTIAGNPVRIGSHQITVKADNEWQKRMTSLQKAAVTAACAFQMRQYGYRLVGEGQAIKKGL